MTKSLILLFLLTSICFPGKPFAQQVSPEPMGICSFKKCTLIKSKNETIKDLGFPVIVAKTNLKSRSICQTACINAGMGQQPREEVVNEFNVYYAYDSTGRICDTIQAWLKKYYHKQKEWDSLYNNKTGDFSFLPMYSGYYVDSILRVPFVTNEKFAKGGIEFILIGQHFYKIECTKSRGLGSLSAFVQQNMEFTYDGRKVHLLGIINQLKTYRELLGKQKCQDH